MQQVISSIQSRVVIDGFGIIQSINQVSSDTLNVTYIKPDSSIASNIVSIPSCDIPGFDNSFTGVGIDDSQELAWSIVLVLVVAFTFRALKRTF